MLSLPVRTRRENTLAQGDFGEWMLKHIDRWFAFARRLGLGIEQMEEIILVTGCDRTRSWTNVAFLGSQLDAHVSFGVNAVDGLNNSINFQFSPEHVRGAVINKGPEGTVCWCFGFKRSWTLVLTLCPLESTREPMCICPRLSCRPYPQNTAKASQGGGRFLSR